ncbi:MAG: arginine--tRNA ligase [Candidatus Babeliales bacterium]|nr:arginine--tRNA ligase [Candidatus Babeliales bacterium]
MNLIENIKESFNNFLQTKFEFQAQGAYNLEFMLNIEESKKDFGDISSNAAMVIAKQLKKNPREIAQTISQEFTNAYIKKIEIAGPGFLNFFLTDAAYIELCKDIFNKKENFFRPNLTEGEIKNYNLEFVSANPTGPLHLGHGRGGIIGDVFGNILKFMGHNVTKEFYINDAGNQINKLGMSLKIRCEQELGKEIALPEESYHGEYLIELAKECIKENGKEVLSQPEEFFGNYAKEKLLKLIQQTLKDYGIEFDVWFSEKTLHTSGAVNKAVETLVLNGFTYEKDGALWFKSTEFGDDKDRVLKKTDGELTYIAADVAYMQNKVGRNFDNLIMVLGQDHHSYVVRLNGIRQALGYNQLPLDVILYQLVRLKEDGQDFKMSKRAGKILSLRDIIDTVGKDVARFFYLNRKADAQLEFDIDLAMKKNEENPVYYIQYAYVRNCSILEKMNETKSLKFSIADANNIGAEEYFLIKKIVSLKELLNNISQNQQIHLLTYYLLELSALFHKYYFDNKIIDTNDIEKSKARLLMISVLRDTFKTSMKLIGISHPERM